MGYAEALREPRCRSRGVCPGGSGKLHCAGGLSTRGGFLGEKGYCRHWPGQRYGRNPSEGTTSVFGARTHGVQGPVRESLYG